MKKRETNTASRNPTNKSNKYDKASAEKSQAPEQKKIIKAPPSTLPAEDFIDKMHNSRTRPIKMQALDAAALRKKKTEGADLPQNTQEWLLTPKSKGLSSLKNQQEKTDE